MIQDKDISIVVQGPVIGQSAFGITDQVTRRICQRLKKLFPESELILSTWKGSNTKGIVVDKLVLNKDPGATSFIYRDEKTFNNCNRLIVSAQGGIKAATRKYVFKVRSDLFLVSKSFLKYFDQFSHFDEQYKCVKSRIIAFSIFSLKSERKNSIDVPCPYHVSDWAFFGHKTDLENFYTVPLTPEPEFSQWFLTRPKFFHEIWPERLWKMSPEEYINSHFFKRRLPLNFAHTRDISHNNVELSERLIANNFLILDQTQFSLISLKHIYLQLLFDDLLCRTAIFYHTWLEDYYKYCKAPSQPLKHRLQSMGRRAWYTGFNRCLRWINHRHNRVYRFVASWLKKKI